MKVNYLSSAACLMLISAPASATDIIFAGTVNGSAFTSYSQDGYTVSKDVGNIINAGSFSYYPNEHLYWGGYVVPTTTAKASFNVTKGGDVFNFISLDYAGEGSGNGTNGPMTFTFTGYNNGVEAFRQEFSGQSIALVKVLSASANVAIDRLNVSGEGWNVRLDNIAVAPAMAAAVPEPATWAMMIGGFGVMGATLRRRRRTPAIA